MKVQDYLPYATCAGIIATAVVSGKCSVKAEKILGEKNLKTDGMLAGGVMWTILK